MKSDLMGYQQITEHTGREGAQVFLPIHALERGGEVTEEIFSLLYQASPDRESKGGTENLELEYFLQGLIDQYGERLFDFVAIKFGIITSAAAGERLFSMEARDIALRILRQHEHNTLYFRDALTQVLEEEAKIARQADAQMLDGYEKRAYAELEELALIAHNPALDEFLKFVRDLDTIFQGRAHLFNYLENRYSTHFKVSRLSPQHLAVQICLDYLHYREHYQLAIISEYERLMRACQTQALQ